MSGPARRSAAVEFDADTGPPDLHGVPCHGARRGPARRRGA
jgi:hypothetical protein